MDIIEYLRPWICSIGNHTFWRDGGDVLERWFRHRNDEEIESRSQGSNPDSDADVNSVDDNSHKDEGGGIVQDKSPRPAGSYSDLRSLSQTNRFFSQLCTPLIHIELDITSDRKTLKYASFRLSQYAEQIQYLRIIVTVFERQDDDSKNYESTAIEALKRCTNATSLEIYYDELPPTPPGPLHPFAASLNAEVVSLLSYGRVQSLAVCSIGARIWPLWSDLIDPALSDLLDTLASRLDDFTSLRVLDINCKSLSRCVYDTLRTKGAALKVLGFQNSLGLSLGRLWDEDQKIKWASNSSLTRLSFTNCQNVYAPHLAPLVNHLPSLKYLFVSACGDNSDLEPPPRIPGWSKRRDEQWQRAPLEMVWIEHMLTWEILAMGLIPTRSVVATSLVPRHLAESFIQDEEIFPGLVALQVEDAEISASDGSDTSNVGRVKDWKVLLTRRSVELKGGARWLVNTR